MLGSKEEIKGYFDFVIETHIQLLSYITFFVTSRGSSFKKFKVIQYKQHTELRVAVCSVVLFFNKKG